MTLRPTWEHGTQSNGRVIVSDHLTGSQRVWDTVLGVVLLVGGVVLAGVFYGDVALTVAGGIVAIIGLALLRYALMRRRRLARG
ncbi:hypothetical protein [Aeromicrobium sp.]|uniref:hypothetical protein n=1 Tax=Aeromicrobium sp. TaxID=1871063 RepID=UPI003C3998A2